MHWDAAFTCRKNVKTIYDRAVLHFLPHYTGGAVVSNNLACGISGAVQHLAGMENFNLIIA